MAVAVQLNEVVKSFGGRNILEGASLEVNDGARVGLIGPNGAGKSTLLRMLAGLETPDAGTVTLRRGAVVAFLPQLVTGDERTVRQWIADARPEHAARAAELEDVERRLAEPALADDLKRMGRLLERQAALVAELAAEDVEGEGLRILRDLGLPDAILDSETRRLSGGQAKLVALTACLVRRPDVLLLDEPEAHLDVSRRTRLEELLRSEPGRGADGQPRPLPARRDRHRDRRARPWAHPACGPGRTRTTRSRASSSSSASASST